MSGLTDDPLRFVTISQALDETVAAHGARSAAIFNADREVMSWKELQRQSDDLAAGLLALGLQRGTRIGICSPNRREWLLAQFGTARIGAVLVTINPDCQSDDLERSLNATQCRALIVARSGNPNDGLGLLRTLAPELDRPGDKPVLESRRLPFLRHVVVLGNGLVPARAERFAGVLQRASTGARRRLPALAAALDPDDAINIQFTSGSTGVPKAVSLSHFGLVNNARHAARNMGLAEVDKLCIAVPLHLGLGAVLGVLSCVSSGATMVFPGERFDPVETLDAISRHRCTAINGTPGLFSSLVERPELDDYDTSSLRTGIVAGSGGSLDLLQRLAERMSLDELTSAYGMTEAGPVVFQTGVEDSLELRAETVGRVHPNIEVKVVDRKGHIVTVGQRGALCVRGYSLMRSYWDEPQRSRDTLDEAGWFRTGDLATLDAEGCCRILGRERDTPLFGSDPLSLDEIGELIRRHPKVQDVQVFGVPNGGRGEEICAWVVLRPGVTASAEEIQAHGRSRTGQDQVPRRIRFVECFPLTASGKVQKFLMRAAMMRELNASVTRTT